MSSNAIPPAVEPDALGSVEPADPLRQQRLELDEQQRAFETRCAARQQALAEQEQRVLECLRQLAVREREFDAQPPADQGQQHEVGFRLEVVQAERDAAWAEVQKLRQRLEAAALPDGSLQQLRHEHEALRAELGRQQDRHQEELTQLQEAFAFRISQLESHQDSAVNLGGPPANDDLQQTRMQIRDYQKLLDEIWAENERLRTELDHSAQADDAPAHRSRAEHANDSALLEESVQELEQRELAVRQTEAELNELRKIFEEECNHERVLLTQERLRLTQERLRVARMAEAAKKPRKTEP